jgi:glycosyltransferase involved in cell wall biosynthesis
MRSAIRDQDYPPDRVEVVVADGGSSDSTTRIARSYGARVVVNPCVTGEAGKAVALRVATGDAVAPPVPVERSGYRRSRDRAAFFHPVACWLTLWSYGVNVLFARGRVLSRDGWRQ